MPRRDAMWSALGAPVDLLVVGGGVTGAGIARDACRRGLSVALVEQHDLASGTSSRSSKLVHGGLRYLEQYEFSLVFEAVSERRILMDIAPHLVNPLGFLFPVFEGSKHGLWLIEAGMWLYDGLSLFRTPRRHVRLKPSDVAKEEPALRRDGLKGAPLYYDCSTNDARLTLETALDAAKCGATVVTRARVVSFLKDGASRVVGVVVQDTIDNTLKEVRAKVVINATGPWTDQTIAMSRPLSGGPLLRPTKGVHVVVDRDRLPVRHAVVCNHPEDGRVLFALPWDDCTYIGTTDTDYEGDPALVAATLSDIDYLIEASNAYFPKHQLTRDDVISTWAGLRPLMAPPESEHGIAESSVSREHQIVVGSDGLITIAGGKLTTYRRMSAEVVDTATKMLRLQGVNVELQAANTDNEPLPGAVGWPEDDDHDKVAAQVVEASGGVLTPEVARYLGDTYGMVAMDIAARIAADPSLATPLVPGRPEIVAQVDHAVDEELAATVSDVMIRRTQLYYRDRDQGLGAAAVVAARMGSRLGWSEATQHRMIADYAEDVALSRRWKTEIPA